MMVIKIRKAKKEDIENIVELNKQLDDFHTKFDKYYKDSSEAAKNFKKDLASIIQKRNVKILVIEDNNKMVGYFNAKIEKPKPFFVPEKIGKISDAFIEEKYRKLGLGKKVLDELIEWFKKNKIKHVELSVDVRNEIGIKAWRKFGFKDFMKKMRLDL